MASPGVPAASPNPTSPLTGVSSSNSTYPLSGSALSSANTLGQSVTPSSIAHSSSAVSTAFSSSSSDSSQTAAIPMSTTTPQTPATSSSDPASPQKSSTPNRLSNGEVAGIVVAVAVGIALLTFLGTFLLMRRRQLSKEKRRYPSPKDSGVLELSTPRQQDHTPVSKKPFMTEASSGPGSYENYLPQSADDRTVQQKVKATLDQIELHLENFYRNSPSSAPRPDNAELALFDSPYLPASLVSLLPRSKNRINIMKHALAQSVTSSISPSASPARSLLPSEYALLPNTVTKARSSVSAKAGEYRSTPCRRIV